MIGLLYIVFFVVYLAISWGVVLAARSWAYDNNRSERAVGIIAGIFMYMLVFWDLIPVFAYHKYLCETQAGFWEYKTPEEWIKENPNVLKDKWNDKDHWQHEQISQNQTRGWVSSGLYYQITYTDYFLNIIRKKEYQLNFNVEILRLYL